MTHSELTNLLLSPETLEQEHLPELLEISAQYPYSAPLHLLILIALHKSGDLRFSSELHKRAPYIPDLSRLFFLLKEHPSIVLQDQREAEPKKEETTSDIISSFLEEHPDNAREVDFFLNSPTPLEESSHTAEDEHKRKKEEDTGDIIAAFLSKGKEAEQLEAPPDPKPQTEVSDSEIFPKEELFTETLARIYVRQGKYERAKHILEQINLEYPKKSSYFAEQISFLDRLIQNSKKEL